jgi:hypothetical protein
MFAEPEGDVSHEPTSDDRVMQALDSTGAVVGFLIMPVAKGTDDLDIELTGEIPPEAVMDLEPSSARS